MKQLPPLNPDTFPEPMQHIVRWHLLFKAADDFSISTGLGLASFWHHAKNGNYDDALQVLVRIADDVEASDDLERMARNADRERGAANV